MASIITIADESHPLNPAYPGNAEKSKPVEKPVEKTEEKSKKEK